MIEGDRVSDSSKKFARLSVKPCMICSVKCVPWSLETVEAIPWEGNTFSNSFFATVRTPAMWQGKPLVHLENIYTTRITYWLPKLKWQLSEVQFKCTTMDGKKQKRGLPGSLEEPSSRSGSPTALTIHLTYSHCVPILVSLIQEQTVVKVHGHQDGKSLSLRGHFCRSRIDFIHMCRNLYRFYCPFSWRSAREF